MNLSHPLSYLGRRYFDVGKIVLVLLCDIKAAAEQLHKEDNSIVADPTQCLSCLS